MSTGVKITIQLDISNFVLQMVDWIAAKKVKLSVGKVKVQIPKQWITMKKNNY
jgi:hypothetical protein